MTALAIAASVAPAVVGFMYQNVGGFAVTLQDMRDVVRGNPNADEAIFWWSYAWHSGKQSDFYRIMCEVPYQPTPGRKFSEDPLTVEGIQKLDEAFKPCVEHAYQPVKLADVEEGDVLVAGAHFVCLLNRWPCRVYKHHGALGVACGGGVRHVGTPVPELAAKGNKDNYYWHPLTADNDGIVIGFRR